MNLASILSSTYCRAAQASTPEESESPHPTYRRFATTLQPGPLVCLRTSGSSPLPRDIEIPLPFQAEADLYRVFKEEAEKLAACRLMVWLSAILVCP